MRTNLVLALALALAAPVACGSDPGGDAASAASGGAGGESDLTSGTVTTDEPGASSGGGGGAGGGGGGTVGAQPPPSPERALAAKLGLGPTFAIGLGNDASGDDPNAAHAYGLGQKLDIHYMYLSGLGWRTWNSPEGAYVTLIANAAKSHGVVPMFTLYQAADWGEANLGAFNDKTFMTSYWRGVRVLFEKLGAFGSPAIAHLEPDLWGYAQQIGGDDPANVPMKVGSLVPECAGMPETVAGFGKCMVKLARALAPKTVVGLSASSFGAFDNAGKSDPARIAAYLTKVGGAEADLMVVETLDRDAGCFEKGADAQCKRSGTFWWDEANVAHPTFHDHLAWAKAIRAGTGKPLLWWQMPLGVPSAAPGGTAGHYRDNRVRYLFGHPKEFADAGGIGAVFGTGASNQTTVKTDNNQFKSAIAGYYQAPAPLL